MPNVVLPIRIDFVEWSQQIQQDLPNLVIPIATSLEGWRSWANQLILLNELSSVPIPTEIGFPKDEHWRKWANYFVESIYFS
jgi:hypothetical protein